MYSDAGFDVSRCGRYLALCELDPNVGYHLRTFSLQKGSMGVPLQTVALPNCPFVTSVQFAPLSFAVLIGYGRCQAPALDQAPQYAVLRCIAFSPRLLNGSDRQLTDEVEIFSVDSTDESNVALFHPVCASLSLAKTPTHQHAHPRTSLLMVACSPLFCFRAPPARVRPPRLPLRDKGRPHPRVQV